MNATVSQDILKELANNGARDLSLQKKMADILASCPRAGSGVHGWCFTTALKLHRYCSDKAELARLLTLGSSECGREVSEVEIDNAVANSQPIAEGTVPKGPRRHLPERNEEQIKTITKAGPTLQGLIDLSPSRRDDDEPHTEDFIDVLFPGNPLLCAGSKKELGLTRHRDEWRGFMVNQQFRKDYWVKGARSLTLLEQAEALRTQKVILITPKEDVSLKINGIVGEVSLQEAVYGPILDALSDYQAKTLGELEQLLRDKGVNFAQIVQAAIILCGTGAIAPAQDSADIAKAKKFTEKLNQAIMVKSRSTNELSYLASPVIGGGVTVGRFVQLFCLAITEGKKKPEEWAQFVWDILAAQGHRLLKEGKTLEMPQDNLVELTEQANVFAQKQLPILKALQIV